MVICEEAKIDKLTAAVAINAGALAGGNFPTSNLGVIFRGLAETAFESAGLGTIEPSEWNEGLPVCPALQYHHCHRVPLRQKRKQKTSASVLNSRNRMRLIRRRRKTLTLMMAMMAVVLIFPLLSLLLPNSAAISYISGKG